MPVVAGCGACAGACAGELRRPKERLRIDHVRGDPLLPLVTRLPHWAGAAVSMLRSGPLDRLGAYTTPTTDSRKQVDAHRQMDPTLQIVGVVEVILCL